jgi:hypothetical protein
MKLLERQFSAAIPGPRPSPLEGLPGRAVRARKPRHGTVTDGAAEKGSAGARVARRKPRGPASAAPDSGPPNGWPDLIAFMGVLATGTLLVLFGHVATGGLTTACLALGGLFAAWWRFRRPRRRQ